MTKQTLGFMTIARFIDNSVGGAISPIGELSTWSETFSNNKGEYSDITVPGMYLTSFSVKDAATLESTTLDDTEVSLTLEVILKCIQYSDMTPQPVDPLHFRDWVQAELFGKIKDLVFGELVSDQLSTVPSWVSFTEDSANASIYRIWLSDAHFKTEYPDFNLTIIPPMPDLRDFLGTYQATSEKLKDWPLSRLIPISQQEKNLNPDTHYLHFTYDFVNRNNPAQKTPTDWVVLVYGEAGNDEDVIKEAIVDKLVKETGTGEDVWKDIFPELFKRTEFIHFPRWDQESIPNMTLMAGMYSSMLNANESLTFAKEAANFYTPEHVEANTLIWSLTYKAVGMVTINGQNNIDELLDLKALYKDFLPVPTSDADFDRMSQATQEWVHLMIRLAIQAEKATSITTLPVGMRRARRGDRTFIAGRLGKASHLVAVFNDPIYTS